MFIDRATNRVWLTIAEVAARWSMTPQSVSQFHVKVGGLPAERVGGQLLVALSDMTQYEQHRLLPDCAAKMKRLAKFKKRIEKPFEVAPPS